MRVRRCSQSNFTLDFGLCARAKRELDGHGAVGEATDYRAGSALPAAVTLSSNGRIAKAPTDEQTAENQAAISPAVCGKMRANGPKYIIVIRTYRATIDSFGANRPRKIRATSPGEVGAGTTDLVRRARVPSAIQVVTGGGTHPTAVIRDAGGAWDCLEADPVSAIDP
jgi:hypothetical protein